MSCSPQAASAPASPELPSIIVNGVAIAEEKLNQFLLGKNLSGDKNIIKQNRVIQKLKKTLLKEPLKKAGLFHKHQALKQVKKLL